MLGSGASLFVFTAILVQYVETGDYEVPAECTTVLLELADAFAEFERCALSSARPFEVCRKCPEQFSNASDKFTELISGTNEISRNCQILVDGGQLSLVKDSYSQIRKIWEDGVCEDCFDPNTFNVSKHVLKFFQEAEAVQLCINSSLPNETCFICENEFFNLTEYFKYDLHSESDRGHCLCGDVIDKMNTTRHQWGNLCFSPDHKFDIKVIIAASITCSVVTGFYIIARVLQNPKDTELARVNTLQSVILEEDCECEVDGHMSFGTENDQAAIINSGPVQFTQ